MSLLRRLRFWWRGECKWPGCHEPATGAYFVTLDYCWPHYYEGLAQDREEREKAEFDREADIIAEGIRRANWNPFPKEERR
jgi:hypothetical protein